MPIHKEFDKKFFKKWSHEVLGIGEGDLVVLKSDIAVFVTNEATNMKHVKTLSNGSIGLLVDFGHGKDVGNYALILHDGGFIKLPKRWIIYLEVLSDGQWPTEVA